MCSIIEEFKKRKTINEVIIEYNNEQIIKEYVEFIITQEYGTLVSKDEFDSFIDIDYKFELPSVITNCIIENPININSFKKILDELSKFNCQNIQLVFYKLKDGDFLKEIVCFLNNYDLRSVELIIPFTKGVLKFLLENKTLNHRILNILIYSTPIEILKTNFENFNVNFITQEITSFKSCGIINQKYFNVNKYKVLESINHNSCLNKKISIDKEGNIKNCPSMIESFGNIKDTTLEEAINKPNFKKYWNITKDIINVCKDCEFRHICTDCRAFTENPKDQYSKPLKCGYSPYTNKWEEWSTNPLKQKAIKYYGMQDLVKNNA